MYRRAVSDQVQPAAGPGNGNVEQPDAVEGEVRRAVEDRREAPSSVLDQVEDDVVELAALESMRGAYIDAESDGGFAEQVSGRRRLVAVRRYDADRTGSRRRPVASGVARRPEPAMLGGVQLTLTPQLSPARNGISVRRVRDLRSTIRGDVPTQNVAEHQSPHCDPGRQRCRRPLPDLVNLLGGSRKRRSA